MDECLFGERKWAHSLIGYAVPVWRDYFEKDYTVYTGSYTVIHKKRGYWVELEDGTTLQSGGAPEGEYTGTLVYACRSKIVVGREDAVPQNS